MPCNRTAGVQLFESALTALSKDWIDWVYQQVPMLLGDIIQGHHDGTLFINDIRPFTDSELALDIQAAVRAFIRRHSMRPFTMRMEHVPDRSGCLIYIVWAPERLVEDDTETFISADRALRMALGTVILGVSGAYCAAMRREAAMDFLTHLRTHAIYRSSPYGVEIKEYVNSQFLTLTLRAHGTDHLQDIRQREEDWVNGITSGPELALEAIVTR